MRAFRQEPNASVFLQVQQRKLFEIQQEQARAVDAENRRQVSESMKRCELRREEQYKKHTSNIQRGEAFLETIEKQMKLQSEAKQNKIKKQYEDWSTHVHGAIQSRIHEQVNDTVRRRR
jgi:hypothetical protein